MWTITIKTLDSQNHQFTEVDQEKTIKEFKERISSEELVRGKLTPNALNASWIGGEKESRWLSPSNKS